MSRTLSAPWHHCSTSAFSLRAALLPTAYCPLPTADCPRRCLEFERIVIDDDFPGGYQVEVADVNGDRKPDVVALGGAPAPGTRTRPGRSGS